MPPPPYYTPANVSREMLMEEVKKNYSRVNNCTTDYK